MHDLASVKAKIRDAFGAVEFPGDWCLVNSREGSEPIALEREFRGKNDWRNLEPSFLDGAPDGFGTALSFFSDEAFHFYLPAYLLADLDGLLKQADPVFHLTHGLERGSRPEKINPRRYGERTWFEHARHKFAMFNDRERAAITCYLEYKRGTDTLTELERSRIDDAINSYWTSEAA